MAQVKAKKQKQTKGAPVKAKGSVGRSGGSKHSRPQKKTHVSQQQPNSFSSKILYPPQQQMLISGNNNDGHWYDIAESTPGRNDVSSKNHKNSKEVILYFRQQADQLYQRELSLMKLNKSSSSSSDQQWMEQTTKQGTMKDRIASMSVLISQQPFHRLCTTMDQLLHLVQAGGTKQPRICQMAGEALADLFINTYLPSERKLISLPDRPLYEYYIPPDVFQEQVVVDNEKQTKNKKKEISSNSSKHQLSPRILMLWRFEEYLKQRYQTFLSLLASWLKNDQLEVIKLFALETCIQLLEERCENESILLEMIVNKLGDPTHKKVVSKTSHLLRHMIHTTHPAMSHVVAREVIQQLIFRPHQSLMVIYQGILFCNQMKLHKVSDNNEDDSTESSLPVTLVKTYFRLFELIVAATSPEQMESAKKRALKKKKRKKQAKASVKDVVKNMSYQKNSSSSNNNGSTSSLLMSSLSSLSSSKDVTGNNMKSRLLNALLVGVNRAHPFLPQNLQGMEDHIDILYKIVHQSSPSTSTQALMLLFHLVVGTPDTVTTTANTSSSNNNDANKNKKAMDRYYRVLYQTISNEQMFIGKHHVAMLFNLIYKSLKYDTSETRIIAILKRLFMTATFHTSNSPSAITCGCLIMLSELTKVHSFLQTSCMDTVSSMFLDPAVREPLGAFKTTDNDDKQLDEDENNTLLANLWELTLLAKHFHPSVVKFTQTLLAQQQQSVVEEEDDDDEEEDTTTKKKVMVDDIGYDSSRTIDYKGDPLYDFTLGPFLDRFAYRHPKKRHSRNDDDDEDSDNEEEEEQTNTTSIHDGRRRQQRTTMLLTAVNEPSFYEESSYIPEDTQFFHRYFHQRAKRQQEEEGKEGGTKQKKKQVDDDDDDDADEWNGMDMDDDFVDEDDDDDNDIDDDSHTADDEQNNLNNSIDNDIEDDSISDDDDDDNNSDDDDDADDNDDIEQMLDPNDIVWSDSDDDSNDDSDSEEEKFINKVAWDMIEEHEQRQDQAAALLDDEDPSDLDNWSDYSGSADDSDSNMGETKHKTKHKAARRVPSTDESDDDDDDDDDDDNDESSGDKNSDSDSSSFDDEFFHNAIRDEDNDNDDDDVDSDDEEHYLLNDDDDDDDDDQFMDNDDSSSDEEEDDSDDDPQMKKTKHQKVKQVKKNHNNNSTKKRKQKSTTIKKKDNDEKVKHKTLKSSGLMLADADDYETLIAQAMKQRESKESTKKKKKQKTRK